MKLYEVPQQSWITPKEDCLAPPGARPVKAGEPIYFKCVDGMYSYCHDKQGRTVHIPANQEVKVLEMPEWTTAQLQE